MLEFVIALKVCFLFTSISLCIVCMFVLTEGLFFKRRDIEVDPKGLPLTAGSNIMMEVDLRENDKEQRTLHFFVNGVQQKVFFTGLPAAVTFAVCDIVVLLI